MAVGCGEGAGPPGASLGMFSRGAARRWKLSLTVGKGSIAGGVRPGTLRAVATQQDADQEGQGDDSYLHEHFHVHERLGQDGETGAQEYLTGHVRHRGTGGRTDRQTESPSGTAGSRSRVGGAGFTGRSAARRLLRLRPLSRPKKRQALARGRPGRGAHACRRGLRAPLVKAISYALAQTGSVRKERGGVMVVVCGEEVMTLAPRQGHEENNWEKAVTPSPR